MAEYKRESIAETIDDFISQFNAAEEMGKEFMYQVLLDLAGKVEELPEDKRTEENRVYGCQSVVYIDSRAEKGRIFFQGDADSQIAKGQLYILLKTLNGRKAAEVLGDSKEHIERFKNETNVISSLTPTRANAFGSMYQHMLQQTAEKCKDAPQSLRNI